MDLFALTDLCTPWCVHVAVTLDVAGHIAAGRTKVSDVARAAGADPDALHRVLRHLVSKGVFEEPAPGTFALNDAARELLSAGARIALNLDGFGGRMAHAWGTLLEAVRTGRPAYHTVFGRDYWQDLEAHPEIAAQFDALMGPAGHGTPDPEVLPDANEWSRIRSVVDVGGGNGSLLAEILKARTHVRGILVDLPRTVERAPAVFREAGVADRATAVGQSFFDPLPAGHDLYVLKNVLGDWPDREAGMILARCGEAARPSGRVVVFAPPGPAGSASPELLMLVLVGGKGRTVEDLRPLARAAGLELRSVGTQPSGRGIAEFVPRAEASADRG